MDFLLYVLAGAGVGFIVGMTGIGGGSLMTPLLLLFGFPPNVAIGTDLLYAATTKVSGAWSHYRQGHVDWTIFRRLALGSIAAALVTGLSLSQFFEDSDQYRSILTSVLGSMLIFTAVVIMLRTRIQRWAAGFLSGSPKRIATLTVLMGVILGVAVTLSSVGAGAIGTAILMVLYPALASTRVVGTDIAHAVPLTFTAGLVHMNLGNVDFTLLGALLVGSIPAIHVSSKLAKHVPDSILRNVLASMLMALGLKYALF
ncbi:sulfite exporter TauE/SafE family protein [Parathalassolituus penaei]|uniref:Probable membrane transporter protein n=1 Tax=Parathalassolituus penaei TaxID=2997323 RepID=A0A9X3ISJ6_9GAMM|nr:sulfite exporter TauE/SafE family protein [Parathalassolituus penaei]MCY0966472.1 sulfite exporter TauE/SafE family protein [Parathalassolituus penaei]